MARTIHFVLPRQTATAFDLPIHHDDVIVPFDPFWRESNGYGKRRASVLIPSHNVPNYPGGAFKAGAKGRVTTFAEIGKTGKPTGCSIVRSSGNLELDDASCRYAMKLRYQPALDFDGIETPSIATISVEWAPGISGEEAVAALRH